MIRSAFVREQFQLKNIEINELTDIFREWRDTPEYFILQGQAEHIQKDLNGDLQIRLEECFRFCKCAKRGNDIYQYLINKKLNKLKNIPKKQFFEHRDPNKKTRALFVTLTYDPKLFDLEEAWTFVGHDWNKFISNLKRKYGKIEFIRAWESHKTGYPHIHATIIFRDHEFSLFTHISKKGKHKGKTSYRIPEKHNKFFHKIWHSRIVDVCGLESLHGGVKETIKYVTKTFNNKKGDLTQALCWVFNKQSYSISKGFVEACGLAKIDLQPVKDHDLLLGLKYNSNLPYKMNWIFIGLVPGFMLGLPKETWFCEIKKPPPHILDVILMEQQRWLQKWI